MGKIMIDEDSVCKICLFCEKIRKKTWNTPKRPREEYQESLFGIERKYPDEEKIRWEKTF